MKKKHLKPIIDELSILSSNLGYADKANVAMVKLLSDRLARIEDAQVEMLKSLGKAVDYLRFVQEFLKKHELDELDRGQTASAVYGLIKRLDEIEDKRPKSSKKELA